MNKCMSAPTDKSFCFFFQKENAFFLPGGRHAISHKLPELRLDMRIARNKIVACRVTDQKLRAGRIGDRAARFAHDERAGGDVPGLQAQLPVAVVAAGSDPGEIERRAAEAAHAGGGGHE